MPKKYKSPRRKPPAGIEEAVLTSSRRRCALCFGLNHDRQEKAGQIAHLDGNRDNWDLDNLCWLCLPHHSQFDSRTSQHKNYTIPEVKEYRRKLCAPFPLRKAKKTESPISPMLFSFSTGAYTEEQRGICVSTEITNRGHVQSQITSWALRIPTLGIVLQPSAIPGGYSTDPEFWRKPLVTIPPRQNIRGTLFFKALGIVPEQLACEPLAAQIVGKTLDGETVQAQIHVYAMPTLEENPDLYVQTNGQLELAKAPCLGARQEPLVVPFEIIFDPKNPGRQFWSVITKGNTLGVQYHIKVVNKTQRTLADVKATTENIGQFGAMPSRLTFHQTNASTCTLDPGTGAFLKLFFVELPIIQPGTLAGESAVAYGPIRVTVSALDTPAVEKTFRFHALRIDFDPVEEPLIY